jgi:transcriptional regulator with GAF, ATPase, and Fis domain
MNAVLKPVRDTEQAFFESQQLPPDKRGVSFEALFYRQLQQVSTKIHETENVEQLMLEASQDICRLFNADRLTLYAINEDRSAIISKVKTGLNVSKDLKLPISAQSIAGYVAFAKQMVNIADVYDDDALKRIHPTLSFLKEVDKRSGYRTKQMLVVPIMDGANLFGVLQVINNKSDQPFGDLEVEGANQLCKTLATAIRQRMQKADDGKRGRATKYDGLVTEGVSTCSCRISAFVRCRSVHRSRNSSAFPMSRSTRAASAPKCCRARSSANLSRSRAGSRLKSLPTAW